MTIQTIAQLCHETNRNYCQSIGDNSQLPWSDAPEWQRQSAIKGVEFRLANPNAPESSSHESWLEEKRQIGWTWGPVKNADKKEHPCFIPFAGLPVEQQVKDALFCAVVDATKRLI